MTRPANAVDFWRGFALIEIFVNHVPGNLYEGLTHRALSQSDSAELFVFLAGWALAYVVGSGERARPAGPLAGRLLLRAGKLYAAHVVIVMMAIALLAATSILLRNPLVLEWFNASAVFTKPVETHIGLVLLTHQLGYFDILPLYVVLLFAAPVIALVHRFRPWLLLPLSLAIYVVALVGQINFRTWPVRGEWFFDPLCWQLAYVLGFLLASPQGPGAWLRARAGAIRRVALPVVIVAAVLQLSHVRVDPTAVPEPHLLFVDAKTFLTPTRILQFLLLVTVMAPVFDRMAPHLPRLASALSLLGRNSLLVFCVGSLLSLAAQLARFAFHGSFVLDTVLVAGGLAISFAAAATAEWWERVR